MMIRDTILVFFTIVIFLMIKSIERDAVKIIFFKGIKLISIYTLLEFIINYWSFNLLIELIIVPIAVLSGAMLVVLKSQNNNETVAKFINSVLLIIGFSIVFLTIKNIIVEYDELVNLQNIKIFFLPLLIYIMSLPLIYILALYARYETLFVCLNKKDLSFLEYQIVKSKILLKLGLNITFIDEILPKVKTGLVNINKEDYFINIKEFINNVELESIV